MTAVNKKRLSIRTCVSCGNKAAKGSLLRFVTTVDRGIILDRSGRINGRGAYVCPTVTCGTENLKRPRLEHVLRVTMTDANWQSLINPLNQSSNLIN